MIGKYLATGCLMLLFLGNGNILAQEQSEGTVNEIEIQNLKDQYKELYTKSESYNNYKVIKNSTLNTFWGTVNDSLNTNRSQIQGLKVEISTLKESNATMKNRIDKLETDLEDAIARTNSLKFLGMNINKGVYNAIVWSIICGLIVLTFFAFSGFIRSKNISATTRKEFRELADEFDAFRKTSHANKVKMGRELQNERNRVEELKESLANAGIKSSKGTSKVPTNM